MNLLHSSVLTSFCSSIFAMCLNNLLQKNFIKHNFFYFYCLLSTDLCLQYSKIPENHGVIQIGRDFQRSVVQTPSQSRDPTKTTSSSSWKNPNPSASPHRVSAQAMTFWGHHLILVLRIILVLGSPKLEAIFQTWLNKCKGKTNNPFVDWAWFSWHSPVPCYLSLLLQYTTDS